MIANYVGEAGRMHFEQNKTVWGHAILFRDHLVVMLLFTFRVADCCFIPQNLWHEGDLILYLL